MKRIGYLTIGRRQSGADILLIEFLRTCQAAVALEFD